MPKQPIYQYYAELDDYEPKIWRRFQVPGNATPARLAYILMTLFEMRASHLYSLEIPGGAKTMYFRCPFEECEDMEADKYWIVDADSVTLSRITDRLNTKMIFTYDFGDSWGVTMVLESVFKDDTLPGKELPRVLEGKGYGIIEDCGGVFGLQDLAKAFKKKKGAEYREYSEWLGTDNLDISAFDIDDMNFRLKKIPRIYAQCYEQTTELTQRSIDLIERKYLKKQKKN